jgi:membrane complex biogenesis BtpA family protein
LDARGIVRDLFGAPRALIGVVHVGALPGSPRAGLSIDRLAEEAVADARRYGEAGFSGLMIENMNDRPYLRAAAGPEAVAAMTAIGREVRRAVPLPLGVQVLAAANREALAVALACGAAFVRVEGFVFAHVADEGLIQADAGALLRYRRQIGADSVRVFADVKKKHSAHAVTADVDLAETAHAAEFFLADGVIVTGVATGREAAVADVAAVSGAVGIPTLVGSGISAENIPRYVAADGFVVGSWLKQEGLWSNPVDPARARALVKAFTALPPSSR